MIAEADLRCGYAQSVISKIDDTPTELAGKYVTLATALFRAALDSARAEVARMGDERVADLDKVTP